MQCGLYVTVGSGSDYEEGLVRMTSGEMCVAMWPDPANQPLTILFFLEPS